MARRKLAEKRIIVTGASSGIGRALALELGRRGAKVLLASRSEADLQEVARAIRGAGGTALVQPTDITNPASRAALFDRAATEWGGLDIHINNAGIAAHGHFVDLTPEVLRQIMEVNFFGMAECTRLAIPYLAMGEQPLLVNVSSMTGRRGMPAWTEYSASKAAIVGFSEALRPELVRFGIDLLLVLPGLTKTNLGKNMLASKGRVSIIHQKSGIEPEELARQLADGIERNQRELWLERDARKMLWANRFIPGYVERRLRAAVAELYRPEIQALEQERRNRRGGRFEPVNFDPTGEKAKASGGH